MGAHRKDCRRLASTTQNPATRGQTNALPSNTPGGSPVPKSGSLGSVRAVKWSLRRGPHRRVLIGVLHSARILVGRQVSE